MRIKNNVITNRIYLKNDVKFKTCKHLLSWVIIHLINILINSHGLADMFVTKGQEENLDMMIFTGLYQNERPHSALFRAELYTYLKGTELSNPQPSGQFCDMLSSC